MVGEPAVVERFLERIVEKSHPLLRKERQLITEFKRNHTNNATAELGPYDL
jgi:Zn-dependent oligopeptidase